MGYRTHPPGSCAGRGSGIIAGGGAYSIQAAIAAVHTEARSFESTDWAQIAVLYGLLAGYDPSPVVRLGRAVALGRARGAKAGLVYLDQLANDAALDRFRPFHIARAVTYQELGDAEGAAYRRALQLPGNRAEEPCAGTVSACLLGWKRSSSLPSKPAWPSCGRLPSSSGIWPSGLQHRTTTSTR